MGKKAFATSPANTPPPEALLQDATCPVDVVGREGGQNAGDDKVIVEEATKELPLLTAQPSPPPPPPMLPPLEIAAAAAAEADGAPPRIPWQEPVEATTPLFLVLDFDIPDFLGGWLPGQLLSHETMKSILFDTQFHRKLRRC